MARGFHTPPECQGQIVNVSYMCAGHHMLMRIYDRSDMSESYYVAPILKRDWKWYETYEQANGEPPIPNSRWKKVTGQRLVSLINEWG
jgi:hypothetical protein